MFYRVLGFVKSVEWLHHCLLMATRLLITVITLCH